MNSFSSDGAVAWEDVADTGDDKYDVDDSESLAGTSFFTVFLFFLVRKPMVEVDFGVKVAGIGYAAQCLEFMKREDDLCLVKSFGLFGNNTALWQMSDLEQDLYLPFSARETRSATVPRRFTHASHCRQC